MPDWFKKVRNILRSASKAADDAEAFRTQSGQWDWSKPRCFIDNLPMDRVPFDQPTFLKWPQGTKVFRCRNGHEFSPGVVPEQSPPLPPSGAEHGEI